MAQNNCNFDAIAPFINNNEDTITACDSAILFFNSQTGLSGTIGPLYLYSWSNGAITFSTSVASTVMYYINVQTLDGCKKFTDSIYVIIYPNPVDPVIQTTIGVIKKAIPKYLCYNKLIVTAPDTAILFASNLPPNFSFYWSTPQGLVYNDSVQVFESGLFEFTVTSSQNTCTKSSCVQVYYYPIDDHAMSGARYERMRINPKFQELVARRGRFAWTLAFVVLTMFYGFVMTVAFSPAALGQPIAEGSKWTVGVVLELFMFIFF